MKMKKGKCVYCFVTRFLLYLAQQLIVTSCHEQAMPRITVLTSQTLDLSPWRGHLDVDIVTLPKENLSFFDAVEVTETISRVVNDGQNAPKAIIGSGNAIIDGLTAKTVGLVTMPFITITRHDNYQVQNFN